MKFKLSLGRNTSNIDYSNLIIIERLHLKDVASFLSGIFISHEKVVILHPIFICLKL
jgi:hypothetical protein